MNISSTQRPDLEASKDKAFVSSSEEVTHDIYTADSSETDVYTTWYGRLFAPLRKVEDALDRKLGVEAQGQARVLPDERGKPSFLGMAALWASCVLNLSAFSTGIIGSELGLDLKRTIVIIIFGTVLGGGMTAWCAIHGPKSGLRQVSISRYSFGWYPSKLIALLNFVEQLGWSAVSAITGGLALAAVSDGKVTSALGVVIIALLGTLVSFIGLRAVLGYESFAWIPVFIVFCIMYGEAGRYADNISPPLAAGVDLSAAALTWFTIVFGSTVSWSSVVCDFYVQYPEDTPAWKTFTYTVVGLVIPTSFAQCLGACVGSTMLVNEDWATTFEEQGLGYLVQEILYPYGFAKFLLVVLVLSGIGNVTVSVYAAAISAQQFAKPLMVVPRSIWTLVVMAFILLLGIIGREHLLEVLQNFLSLLGYWNTSFFAILFTEHFCFRQGNYDNYELRIWNDRRHLPLGIAAFFAFAMGVAGWILGMAETWYTGRIAAMIGSEGGDIGNQLSFLFTLVSYPPARWLEYRLVGK